MCLIDESKEKAEYQDFLVPDASISDDVMSWFNLYFSFQRI